MKVLLRIIYVAALGALASVAVIGVAAIGAFYYVAPSLPAVESLKECNDHAQKLGVVIGVEPINRFETFFINRAAQAIAMVCGEPLTSSALAGLEDWLRWVRATPIASLDWRDRMFIEQRQAATPDAGGRWAS